MADYFLTADRVHLLKTPSQRSRLILYHCLQMMHALRISITCTSRFSAFKPLLNVHLESTKDLFIERARTNVRKEIFSLRVTRLWNDLPEVVVTAPSVNSFKNHLDRHWSTEEFLYNYKAALPGSYTAFQGKVEDLTT